MVAYANTFSRSFLYLPAKIQQLFETRNNYEEKRIWFRGQIIKCSVNTNDETSLQLLAENEYNLWCYDGYEGSLTGWLVPFCKPTDIAEVRDRESEYKNGSYYVVATDTEISAAGGRRKVILGRKMSS